MAFSQQGEGCWYIIRLRVIFADNGCQHEQSASLDRTGPHAGDVGGVADCYLGNSKREGGKREPVVPASQGDGVAGCQGRAGIRGAHGEPVREGCLEEAPGSLWRDDRRRETSAVTEGGAQTGRNNLFHLPGAGTDRLLFFFVENSYLFKLITIKYIHSSLLQPSQLITDKVDY